MAGVLNPTAEENTQRARIAAALQGVDSWQDTFAAEECNTMHLHGIILNKQPKEYMSVFAGATLAGLHKVVLEHRPGEAASVLPAGLLSSLQGAASACLV
jgi:hypothetical protein